MVRQRGTHEGDVPSLEHLPAGGRVLRLPRMHAVARRSGLLLHVRHGLVALPRRMLWDLHQPLSAYRRLGESQRHDQRDGLLPMKEGKEVSLRAAFIWIALLVVLGFIGAALAGDVQPSINDTCPISVTGC